MKSRLAIAGGRPVREQMLPYGRQTIDDEDIAAITATLRADYLTGGPWVGQFEAAIAATVGAQEAVAVNSGTAALHAAMAALQIGPGDEVIVPALTFVATANCVLYQGGSPVFADIEPDTLLISPASIEAKLSARTRAIIAVDYAGQPCDYAALHKIARRYGIALVADACHALGAEYQGTSVGSLADINVFSFHPVKAITTGEGGAAVTNDTELAKRMRAFRNHGMSTDFRQREMAGRWGYDIETLGYNYRISDLQCALGVSQLRHLPAWLARRRDIAATFDKAFGQYPIVSPLKRCDGRTHAYHLYVVTLALERLTVGRDQFLQALRAEGIGANVHYRPVHLQPLYQQRIGTCAGICPGAEVAYSRIMSLPIFPTMNQQDVNDVIQAVEKVSEYYAV